FIAVVIRMAFSAIMTHAAEGYALFGSLGRMALFAVVDAGEQEGLFFHNACFEIGNSRICSSMAASAIDGTVGDMVELGMLEPDDMRLRRDDRFGKVIASFHLIIVALAAGLCSLIEIVFGSANTLFNLLMGGFSAAFVFQWVK